MRGGIALAGYDDWDLGLGVLLGGVINGIHTFLPHLLGHGEGAQIVCTASTSGVLPAAGSPIYNTAKAAVVALWTARTGQTDVAAPASEMAVAAE